MASSFVTRPSHAGWSRCSSRNSSQSSRSAYVGSISRTGTSSAIGRTSPNAASTGCGKLWSRANRRLATMRSGGALAEVRGELTLEVDRLLYLRLRHIRIQAMDRGDVVAVGRECRESPRLEPCVDNMWRATQLAGHD